MANPVVDRLDNILRENAGAHALLQKLTSTVSDIAKHLKKGTGSGPGKGGKGTGTGAADTGSSLAKLGAGLAKAGAAAGAAVGAMLAIPLAVAGIVAAAIPFVKALSPATVELFDRRLADLMATIGHALIPIIEYAASTLQQWAGQLLPLMNELRPVIERVSAAVSGLFVGAMRLVVAHLSTLLKVVTPLIDQFSGLIDGAGQLLEVFAAVWSVVSSFSEVLTALKYMLAGPLLAPLVAIFGNLTDEGTSFKSMLGQLASAAGFAAAGLMKMLGATETLAKFKAALQKNIDARRNPAGGLTAAPTDAAIQGIQAIAAKMTERAFIATSGGSVARAETDIMEDILKAVDAGEAADWKKIIADGVREGMKALPGGETAVATIGVARTVLDPSATGASRAAAAREAGGGWVGAGAARVAGWGSDLVDWVF